MINLKILIKALGYMFLPTVSISALLFFIVFDLSLLKNIIIGQSGLSYFIRFVILSIEIVLVVYMYNYYIKQDSIQKEKEEAEKFKKQLGVSDLPDPSFQLVSSYPMDDRLKVDRDRLFFVYKVDDKTIVLKQTN